MKTMNCTCGSNHVVQRLGVERCGECGKLTGADVFVPFRDPLPARARQRKMVSPLSEYATACICHCRESEHEADVDEDGRAIVRCTVRDQLQPHGFPFSCHCVYAVLS
jgi:hypothetical protein